jgi:hypothetical protein
MLRHYTFMFNGHKIEFEHLDSDFVSVCFHGTWFTFTAKTNYPRRTGGHVCLVLSGEAETDGNDFLIQGGCEVDEFLAFMRDLREILSMRPEDMAKLAKERDDAGLAWGFAP